jgi:hypothetical protein
MNSQELWQEARNVVLRIRRNELLIRSLVLVGLVGAVVPVVAIAALYERMTVLHFRLCFGILGIAVLALLYAIFLLWSNRQAFRRLLELNEVRTALARELSGKQMPSDGPEE